MRAVAIAIVVLLAAPLVGSVWHAPHASLPPFPNDLSDADLLRLVATHAGYRVPLHGSPVTTVPAGLTLPDIMQKLALRAGARALSASELAPFLNVDPRVAGPVLLLLVAVDHAWDARDAAYAKLSPGEQRELAALTLARVGSHAAPSAREQELDLLVNKEMIVQAAIDLDDTLEGIVMPALQRAVQSGAWPPVAVADPVGVLRLGSPGNDVERLNRMVQIDPSGDDTYYNNAGGASFVPDITPIRLYFPVAISVDMAGNDHYENYESPAQGGATDGVIGVLLDYAGNDQYVCAGQCQGGAVRGVGLLHDYSGDDSYTSYGAASTGGASDGLGVFRDDAGNDSYNVIEGGGEAETQTSFGLLWDRGGTDYYYTDQADFTYGWATNGGHGWLVDEGPELDYYADAFYASNRHGCNDCTWTAGHPSDQLPVNGHGWDNAGGLASALANDDGFMPKAVPH